MTPKQVESIREGLRRNVRMGADLDAAQATADVLLALLRRDWARRVLTEQAIATRMNVPQIQRDALGRTWSLFVYVGDERAVFTTPHPDGAQDAAARAVYPTLSAELRAKLGERP